MDAGANWGWVSAISAAAGSGAMTLLTKIFLEYTNKPDRIEGWVEKDQDYRAELAFKIRRNKIGATYRDFLTRGLDWLDRNWGEASSARSLGVCVIIALCYSYAAFFIAWGVGGPGTIGGFRVLAEVTQPGRGLCALCLVAAPPVGFAFGRWVGHQERRWKLRLRRRLRARRQRFEIGYRAGLVVVFGILVAVLSSINKGTAIIANLSALLAVAPTAGIAAARRSRRFFVAGLLAAGAGAGAVTLAIAVTLAVAIVSVRSRAPVPNGSLG